MGSAELQRGNSVKLCKQAGEDRIFTLPNLISLVRLALIPIFFIVYVFFDQIILGSILFALAAATDWIDGQVARITHTVTKLGKVLDPFIDRLLLIFGVIAIFVAGRLPLWIMLLVFSRDIILGILAIWLKRKYDRELTVSYVGKCATACMMVAFCMLLLNWPIVAGLSWFDVRALPGFGGGSGPMGIFFAYVGVLLQWITAVIYIYRALRYGTTEWHFGSGPGPVKAPDSVKAKEAEQAKPAKRTKQIDSDAVSDTASLLDREDNRATFSDYSDSKGS